MTAAERKLRSDLRKIGGRRKRLNRESETLSRQTKSALLRAKAADIPIGEAAGLVGVSRSTAYEVYLGVNNADRNGSTRTNPGTAHGSSGQGKRHSIPARKVQGAGKAKPKRRRSKASAGTSS